MNVDLKSKAISLGATEFGISRRTDKKYYVIYNGKRINFGAKGSEDFTIHRDQKRKLLYRKRHEAIKNKNGELVYKLKTSPAYWSYNLLWS